jgi:hypothetical protein
MGGIIYQIAVSLGVTPFGFNVPMFGFSEGDDVWF